MTFGFAIVVAPLTSGCGDSLSGGLFASRAPAAVSAADQELTPAGVVTEQMRALAAWQSDPNAELRVFSFASPGNRAVTGPLERFEGLIESEPYMPLVENQGYAIGRAVEKGDAATVLVTLVDRSGAIVAYRFYLRRQEGEPGRRWMTDAVYRFTPDSPGGPSVPFI